MTTEELIQLLSAYPADLRVMVQGYEDGYDDLEADREGRVSLREHTV